MPHLRKRYLESSLKKGLGFSPIVGLLGHRQVGKTTLASKLATKYATLDLRDTLLAAEDNPEQFLANNSGDPFVIDECQLCPNLFPALKDRVRTHSRPGQFLLTGSVRFSSRKQIRESLTGRIVNYELLPMNLREIKSIPLDKAWESLTRTKKAIPFAERSPLFNAKDFDLFVERGGLPGIFAIRDSLLRQKKIETQIETILERDLRLLQQTTLDYRSLKNFLFELSKIQGLPLELTALARSTRISLPTVKKLLSSLQAMFVIRILKTEGGVKQPVLFFEDVGESSFLLKEENLSYESKAIRGLYATLRHSFDPLLTNLSGEFFQFRSRGGAHVPLAIKVSLQRSVFHVGLIPSSQDVTNPSMIRSAQSFIKNFPNSVVFIVHNGKRVFDIQENIILLPLINLL